MMTQPKYEVKKENTTMSTREEVNRSNFHERTPTSLSSTAAASNSGCFNFGAPPYDSTDEDQKMNAIEKQPMIRQANKSFANVPSHCTAENCAPQRCGGGFSFGGVAASPKNQSNSFAGSAAGFNFGGATPTNTGLGFNFPSACGGFGFEDNFNMYDHGDSFGGMNQYFQIYILLEPGFPLNFKRRIMLNVNSTNTIEDIKRMIQARLGYSIGRQCLSKRLLHRRYHGDQKILKNKFTLSDYDLHYNYSCLYLTIKPVSYVKEKDKGTKCNYSYYDYAGRYNKYDRNVTQPSSRFVSKSKSNDGSNKWRKKYFLLLALLIIICIIECYKKEVSNSQAYDNTLMLQRQQEDIDTECSRINDITSLWAWKHWFVNGSKKSNWCHARSLIGNK